MVFRLVLTAVALVCAQSVRAETVNCTNITSLPATINTQGIYCLKQDVSTSITNGAAIAVNVNNVTIDCNGYKLGGLGGGPATGAIGIQAIGRVNVIVRNCSIRGFSNGVLLNGSANQVENSRFDGNRDASINMSGDGGLIRGNLIFDTGSPAVNTTPSGIYASASVDIRDNTVSGVIVPAGSNSSAFGIRTFQNLDGVIEGNRVRGVIADGFGSLYGILNEQSGHVALRGNIVSNPSGSNGTGVHCGSSDAVAGDNYVSGYSTGVALNCTDAGGNVSVP
jgi:hypothetical protein